MVPTHHYSSTFGAVPRQPMREQSAITAFDTKIGDPSRSVLFAALGAVTACFLGIFYFSQPPPEVQRSAGDEVRHNLPKDLVRAALARSPEATAQAPAEVELAETRAANTVAPETRTNAAALEIRAASAVAPEAQRTENAPVRAAQIDPAPRSDAREQQPEILGRLALTTVPEVDVYDGNTFLGRTPLTAKLPAGARHLRFTDKETGLNIYRTLRIRPGDERNERIAFGTSELLLEAPDGSAITLNARPIGIAPLDPIKIYEGTYELKVTHRGESWTQSFEAPPRKTINYRVTLSDL